MKEALTFDDVLLVPRYSDIRPRNAVTKTKFSRNVAIAIPFSSAPMDTVTEHEMAIALAEMGGIGIIHKNLSVAAQAKEVALVKRAKHGKLVVGAAIGVGPETIERARALAKAGADVVVVDTAHGHSKGVIDTVKACKKDAMIRCDIVAGNIGTAEGARALIQAGADGVKVGIGPGSICTTRVVAGIGVPQISAVTDAVRGRGRNTSVPIIADGGIKYSGDIAKALAVGADAVMIGGLFAGTDEAPGRVITVGGKKYKAYRGMGSVAAMKQGSKDRYGQGSISDSSKFVPEGIEGRVPYRGSVGPIVYQLEGGLRAGMAYLGARTIAELHKKAKFVRITNAGLIESHPHDVAVAKEAPNYRS